MLQPESRIQIVDNTICSSIRVLARSRLQPMVFGTVLRGSIQSIRKSKVRAKRLQAFKKGQLCKVLILTTRYAVRRLDFFFKATRNTGCLLATDGSPIATRIRGVLFREIPAKNIK